MRIVLAAVGRMKRGPERELVDRYIDRAQATARQAGLAGVFAREFIESRARDTAARQAEEARALQALVGEGSSLVLFDERGDAMGSEAFAGHLGRLRDGGAGEAVLALGGPDGHGDDLRARADFVIAFGAMTWPHQLARIMAAEQIYRAVTILCGHPYHRR